VLDREPSSPVRPNPVIISSQINRRAQLVGELGSSFR